MTAEVKAGNYRGFLDSSFSWREVDKDKFYAVIGPQNVSPAVEGKYPYTSVFTTPRGDVRGKAIGYMPDGCGLSATRYFLPPGRAEGE